MLVKIRTKYDANGAPVPALMLVLRSCEEALLPPSGLRGFVRLCGTSGSRGGPGPGAGGGIPGGGGGGGGPGPESMFWG